MSATPHAAHECFIYDSLKEAMSKAGLGPLPAAHVYKWEPDESINLGWYLQDARLGFNIEIDPSESGWHVLRKDADGKLTHMEWGHMATFDADKVVAIMWGQPTPEQDTDV